MMNAFSQTTDLGVHGTAAVDWDHFEVLIVHEFLGFVADLDGQLARRHQHEAGRFRRFGRFPAFEEREQIGSGFTRAGLRLPHDIGAGEDARDKCLLNAAGRFVAGKLDGGEKRGRKPESGEPGRFHQSSGGQKSLQRDVCTSKVARFLRGACDQVNDILVMGRRVRSIQPISESTVARLHEPTFTDEDTVTDGADAV